MAEVSGPCPPQVQLARVANRRIASRRFHFARGVAVAGGTVAGAFVGVVAAACCCAPAAVTAASPAPVLRGLFRYPVKGCRGEALELCGVGEAGLAGDRSYAVACGGRALTQRECPRLASISAELESGSLRLSAPGVPCLELPLGAAAAPGAGIASASLFGAGIVGVDEGDEAATWVSAATGFPGCRLLRREPTCQRRAVGYHWADIAPLLVVSVASWVALCKAAGRQIPMDRFRPNMVVDGPLEPHAEDSWKTIRLGGVEMDAVGPCARCNVVEVDQAAAERDNTFSVYGALLSYRGQAVFGQYFQPPPGTGASGGGASLLLGAQVEVLR